ncbi:MAG: MOSC domain-containing protein [Desulfuromonadales bacterium]|nr:MOSC domain-containing protein [Desulfuromonadales bacterium]MDT8422894.1 MOSC domain-containing protein [Desulfuromonadales bacterium]
MENVSGRIVAVCRSAAKGERKKSIPVGELVVEHGLANDGHAGPGHRQISLLAQESIDKMCAAGLDVHAGDFAENITTRGIELPVLPIGTRLALGDKAVVEVTQIGKECHQRCAIYHQAGDCVMPREGIFARVVVGGAIRAGDRVAPIADPVSVDRSA